MKLAFLVMAHSHPDLLARLLRRLEAPNASLYVHVDRGTDIRPFKRRVAEACTSSITWVPRVRSSWGTFGQVRASLSLLTTAMAGEPEAAMFILISEADYPLRSPE